MPTDEEERRATATSPRSRPEGRLAAAVLIVVGITLWAAVTGTITSVLITAQSAEVSAAERIRQLADLRRDDLVTEAEFDAKKAELLAKM